MTAGILLLLFCIIALFVTCFLINTFQKPLHNYVILPTILQVRVGYLCVVLIDPVSGGTESVFVDKNLPYGHRYTSILFDLYHTIGSQSITITLAILQVGAGCPAVFKVMSGDIIYVIIRNILPHVYWYISTLFDLYQATNGRESITTSFLLSVLQYLKHHVIARYFSYYLSGSIALTPIISYKLGWYSNQSWQINRCCFVRLYPPWPIPIIRTKFNHGG